MNYTRNCPKCSTKIIYKNKDSFRVCLTNQTLCKKCGLELRKKNTEEKEDKLKDKEGFIFRPKKDITSQVINCWKILGFSGHRTSNKSRFYFWDTQCTNCGIVASKDISHINKTQTCRHCKMMKRGEAGLNVLFYAYKSNTKKETKREFSLTRDEFQEITSKNCYYCAGVPIRTICGAKTKYSDWGVYTFNGIDRLDNEIGYVKLNCVPCCKRCNWAKGISSAEDFKAYIRGICSNAAAGNIGWL